MHIRLLLSLAVPYTSYQASLLELRDHRDRQAVPRKALSSWPSQSRAPTCFLFLVNVYLREQRVYMLGCRSCGHLHYIDLPCCHRKRLHRQYGVAVFQYVFVCLFVVFKHQNGARAEGHCSPAPILKVVQTVTVQ